VKYTSSLLLLILILNIKLSAQLRDSVNSFINQEKTLTAEGLKQMDIQTDQTSSQLRKFSDSLKNSRRNILSDLTLYNISSLANMLQQKMQNISDKKEKDVNDLRRKFSAMLQGAQSQETLESFHNNFTDTLNAEVDNFSSIMDDFLDNAKDSLENYADYLKDAEADAKAFSDSLADYNRSYGLFLHTGYEGVAQFRGYRGENSVSALIPGIEYKNPNGIGLLINAYKYKGTSKNWNMIEVGASYDFNITSSLGAYIGYNHYFFRDSIETDLAGVKGILGGALSYDFDILTASLLGDLIWGDNIDGTIGLDLSRRLDLYNTGDILLFIQPEAASIYGTQYITNNRVVKVRGRKHRAAAVPSVSSVFSVLSYQFHLPLYFNYGRLYLQPAYNYIIPKNQPADFTSGSYSYFSIDIAFRI
jgi:hypothetical protein